MNREAAYGALLRHLKERCPSIKRFDRRVRDFDDVDKADMPYCGFSQGNQIPQQVKGRPYIWHFPVKLYIYVRSDSVDEAPAAMLNNTLDEIEAAMALDNLGRLNLGKDFIDSIRFDGEIETDEGILGDLAVAIVPILMIVTQ